jgi:hypothetical protein
MNAIILHRTDTVKNMCRFYRLTGAGRTERFPERVIKGLI